MTQAREPGVLRAGLSVLGHGIREQPRIFAVAVVGGSAFGLLTIGGAVVIGQVVGRVVVPALRPGPGGAGRARPRCGRHHRPSPCCRWPPSSAGGWAPGSMQFRLQADYRRRVTRRYLELPLAWHRRQRHRHAAVQRQLRRRGDLVPDRAAAVRGRHAGHAGRARWSRCSSVDWAFALVGLAIFPALFALNVVYSRRMSPRIARAQALRARDQRDRARELRRRAGGQDDGPRGARRPSGSRARAGELRDAMIRVGRLRGVFDPLLDMLPNLGTLAVLVVGVVRLRQGAVDIADVVSVSFLFTVLAFPVRAIGWVLTELPRSVVGWERVQTGAHRDRRDAVRRDARWPGDRGRPRCGCAGSASATTTVPPVLPTSPSTCRPGRTVALVGPTGSGKSTIASLAVPPGRPGRRHGRARRRRRAGADRGRAWPRRSRWCRRCRSCSTTPCAATWRSTGPAVDDDRRPGGAAAGPGRRLRRPAAGRPRHHGRRARHLAVRRPAPAAHPGPGARRRAPAARARRRDQRGRPAGRGGDPGRAAPRRLPRSWSSPTGGPPSRSPTRWSTSSTAGWSRAARTHELLATVAGVRRTWSPPTSGPTPSAPPSSTGRRT